MKKQTYKSKDDAWKKVVADHPEFAGLDLPAEGRKISGRKHATARYEDRERKGKVKFVHVVVVGAFTILLLLFFVI